MKNRLYKFVSVLSEKTELPLTEICKEFSASLSGRREVIFNGVVSIEKYEEYEIKLSLCGDNVTISGKSLELKSFYKTSLRICGKITKIEFGGQKDDRTA